MIKRRYYIITILLVILLFVCASCNSPKAVSDKGTENTADNITLAGETKPDETDKRTEEGEQSTGEKQDENEETEGKNSSGAENQTGAEGNGETGGQTGTGGGAESGNQTNSGGSTNTENPSENIKPTEPAAQQPENPGKTIEEQIEYYMNKLTLEEKICQMFVVHPEKLVNNPSAYTIADEATRNAINNYPVGGVIYFDANLKSESQVKIMLANTQQYSLDRIGLPMLLCVDEEGGKVARIAGSGRFNVPVFENMSVIGAAKDINRAYSVGDTIGGYLSRLGFNVDFAPVADVLSNPDNTVVKLRSFGSSPTLVSNMTLAVSKGLNKHGVYSSYKHFPGHGATEGDTHEGYAYTSKTLEELKACELVPFQNAINNGADFIMVGHISVPSVTGDNTPASLSYKMITEILRNQMGYNGIVITDSMSMGAITNNYSADEAVIRTIEAGTDIVLMPQNLEQAYNAVLSAVKSGRISENRINESVRRILKVKLNIKKNM